MAVTLRDIAREAGVSVSVASRVLNKDLSLRTRPDTRQRVERIALELGYHPNHGARSLRLARTAAIAFVVPEVNNAIFSEVIRGVEDGATELGLDVLLGSGQRLDPTSGFLGRLDAQRRVDGFLIQPGDTEDPEQPGLSTAVTSPSIWLNTRRAAGSVYLDNRAAGRVGAQHLLDLGHRRIGLIGGRPESYTAREREAGVADALRAAGLDLREEWVRRAGYGPVEGAEAAAAILSADDRPTALVVSNVNAAIGALSAARERGIRIPEDLSVVAVHDVWFADYAQPRLTVVRMPLYEMGYHGILDLHRAMEGQAPGERRIVDPAPELVVRESTRAL